MWQSHATMSAAVVDARGVVPRCGQWRRPSPKPGTTVLTVEYAALNPIDVSIVNGRFYGGSPRPPFVIGQEAVGRVIFSDRFRDGALVWGMRRHARGAPGTAAEVTAYRSDDVVPIDDGVDPAAAAAAGMAGLTAWSALVSRGRMNSGDSVLVLGATGMVGLAAVQIARHCAVRRLIAAGRDRAQLALAERLGADAAIVIEDPTDAAQLRRSVSKAAPTLILDPLWGPTIELAMRAAAHGARIIQIGEANEGTAILRSALIRGGERSILGFALAARPPAERSADFQSVMQLVSSGHLQLPRECFKLRDVESAWSRLMTTPRRRVLLRP